MLLKHVQQVPTPGSSLGLECSSPSKQYSSLPHFLNCHLLSEVRQAPDQPIKISTAPGYFLASSLLYFSPEHISLNALYFHFFILFIRCLPHQNISFVQENKVFVGFIYHDKTQLLEQGLAYERHSSKCAGKWSPGSNKHSCPLLGIVHGHVCQVPGAVPHGYPH